MDGEEPLVKKEPEEGGEDEHAKQAAKEGDDFLANPADLMSEMAEAATTIKQMVAMCSSTAYADTFRTELEACATKLDRTNKILSKICMGQEVVKSRVGKLLSSVAAQKLHVAHLKTVGTTTFGMKIKGVKGRKRPRTSD